MRIHAAVLHLEAPVVGDARHTAGVEAEVRLQLAFVGKGDGCGDLCDLSTSTCTVDDLGGGWAAVRVR